MANQIKGLVGTQFKIYNRLGMKTIMMVFHMDFLL